MRNEELSSSPLCMQTFRVMACRRQRKKTLQRTGTRQTEYDPASPVEIQIDSACVRQARQVRCDATAVDSAWLHSTAQAQAQAQDRRRVGGCTACLRV